MRYVSLRLMWTNYECELKVNHVKWATWTEIKIITEIRNYFCVRTEIRNYLRTEIRIRTEIILWGGTEIGIEIGITLPELN